VLLLFDFFLRDSIDVVSEFFFDDSLLDFVELVAEIFVFFDDPVHGRKRETPVTQDFVLAVV
jgi:hypothetical protein